uniref:Protein Vpu n=1 Tax=Human immunodeficiency virus type 1 TaxID=11676 RepID=A0A0U4E822_HV1|nr:vpu protein [Human immunodeficiency virus 1]
MQYKELLFLLAYSALSLITALIWIFVLKLCLEQKRQEKREREILDRLRRIREIRDDSDYESNEEEEQEVMDLVHNHGFVNPMFEL